MPKIVELQTVEEVFINGAELPSAVDTRFVVPEFWGSDSWVGCDMLTQVVILVIVDIITVLEGLLVETSVKLERLDEAVPGIESVVLLVSNDVVTAGCSEMDALSLSVGLEFVSVELTVTTPVEMITTLVSVRVRTPEIIVSELPLSVSVEGALELVHRAEPPVDQLS